MARRPEREGRTKRQTEHVVNIHLTPGSPVLTPSAPQHTRRQLR